MRGRRAAAWVVDVAPLLLAIVLVAPEAVAYSAVRVLEHQRGLGLVVAGQGDVLEAQHHAFAMRASTAAVQVVAFWIAVQAMMLLAARRTMGKRMFGVTIVDAAGGPASRSQVMAREYPRLALFACIPIAHAILARLPQPPPRADWMFYAPSTMGVTSQGTGRALAELMCLALLAAAAIGLAAWEAKAVFADARARTLGDRVAGTRVD